MKQPTGKASASWRGTHQHGKGVISTPSATLKNSPYSSGLTLKQKKSTNPGELVAAAHAASFSMALAQELGGAGFSPEQIDTTATLMAENIATKWTFSKIHLDVGALVPKAAHGDFIDAVLRAKASCPISRLLGANISIHAKLNRRRLPARPSQRLG